MKSQPSRSVYFFLEIMIVILFFTVSAAVCVYVSAQASIKSDRADAKRYALIKSENLIEVMKTTDVLRSEAFIQDAQTSWHTTWYDEQDRTYDVRITIQEQTSTYCAGNMQVLYQDELLFSLPFVNTKEGA